MMHEMCAKPELPRQEQFRTSGLPKVSCPSSRQSQHDGWSSGACAVVMVMVDVAGWLSTHRHCCSCLR
eukprot:scaffold390_cov149-Skeletonema_menzelii.AAC.7